eukprot:m.333591 g.333591  ORF g.333591 m.333591 type:complete len:326 (-) comp17177_c0_seq1:93-1070(-)
MGNLLGVLKDRKGSKTDHDFFIDFENAKPNDSERAVYDQVQAVLTNSQNVLESLAAYAGAGDHIRAAISNPNDDALQTAAWDSVCPLVSKLKSFYEYSSEVEGILPILLEGLCSTAPVESLETKQALAKQWAEILSFVLKFDDLKMNNPAIQNDFSYYRRTLSKMKMKDPSSDDSAVVSNEEANRMSLFYAYPTPMLKCVSEATSKFVSENKSIPIENTTDCLAIMATVCRIMIEQPNYYDRFTDKNETIAFCQRVMVACVIVYDHVHLVGAFAKKNSAIDIKATIKALKMHENSGHDTLMNALKYTTKHLNDEETPKAVKALLA